MHVNRKKQLHPDDFTRLLPIHLLDVFQSAIKPRTMTSPPHISSWPAVVLPSTADPKKTPTTKRPSNLILTGYPKGSDSLLAVTGVARGDGDIPVAALCTLWARGEH
ncbi:hypothetical protein NQZ68_003400 [Dissostichus eleginoides]|nr:hypothetical protein NQZ68_003400 [Dissostichus eleginoides]